MNNCNNCGAPLDDDALFCANCGKKIAPQGKTCPKCGAKVEEESVFCIKCGSKLDTQAVPPINSTQVVNSVTPAQEEVFYELEEKTSKKWRYIICGIFVVILAFGWCSYKIIHKSKNLDIIELTSDEESIFVELVNKWSELHNNKGFDDRENCPYAEIIYYYGTKMVGIDAAQEKQKALTAKSDYSQECTNIKVTKITEKLFVCNFEKHTHSNGKDKVHHDCYLYFSDEGEGVWKIKEESDENRHRSKKCGKPFPSLGTPPLGAVPGGVARQSPSQRQHHHQPRRRR